MTAAAGRQSLMRVNSKSLDRLGQTREFTRNAKNNGIERRWQNKHKSTPVIAPERRCAL